MLQRHLSKVFGYGFAIGGLTGINIMILIKFIATPDPFNTIVGWHWYLLGVMFTGSVILYYRRKALDYVQAIISRDESVHSAIRERLRKPLGVIGDQ
jgi:hypothetical protein